MFCKDRTNEVVSKGTSIIHLVFVQGKGTLLCNLQTTSTSLPYLSSLVLCSDGKGWRFDSDTISSQDYLYYLSYELYRQESSMVWRHLTRDGTVLSFQKVTASGNRHKISFFIISIIIISIFIICILISCILISISWNFRSFSYLLEQHLIRFQISFYLYFLFYSIYNLFYLSIFKTQNHFDLFFHGLLPISIHFYLLCHI